MDWPELTARFGRPYDVLGSTMFVLDSGGDGPPLVFLHGNPTSSYLWRHVIGDLGASFRCVAVDLIGMGRSGRPAIDYAWADHRRFLAAVLDRVPGDELWLVAHDWGVGLGLEYARTHPDRVAGVALLEGHLRPLASWAEFDDAGRDLFTTLRDPVAGRRMVQEENFFLDAVLPAGIVRTLDPDERAAYAAPFATAESRYPIWRWVTQIPIAGDPPEVADALTANRAWLAGTTIPRLLLHARPGAILGPEAVADLAATVPGLGVVDVGEGRHFLPEDQPAAIAAALAGWRGESAVIRDTSSDPRPL